jgi:hypothetical protein
MGAGGRRSFQLATVDLRARHTESMYSNLTSVRFLSSHKLHLSAAIVPLSPPRIFRIPRYIFTRGDAHLPVRDDRVRIQITFSLISFRLLKLATSSRCPTSTYTSSGSSFFPLLTTRLYVLSLATHIRCFIIVQFSRKKRVPVEHPSDAIEVAQTPPLVHYHRRTTL